MGEETQAADEPRHGRAAGKFDPVAGMRVMADIQAEGLRAAGELLERMLRSEPDRNGRAPSPVADYMTLVDTWADLVRQTVFGSGQPGQPGAVTVPVDASGVGPAVRLALDDSAAHTAANAEVWLHNGTDSAVGPLVMRCGALRNSDGKKLKGAKVRFAPREVEVLPPRSSRAVTVSVAPEDAPRPGIYRGTIQAQGAPSLWLPLEVTIAPC